MTILKKRRINFSYFAAASVNLMSVLAGIGYAWSSPCIPKLTGQADPEYNPLPQPASAEEISWITSLHCLGAISGPLFTGIIAAKFGKKKTLLLFAIPQIMSNVMLIFANNLTHFYIARFLLGIGTGCVFSLIPVYVAEISEVTHRGRTSMFFPLMVTVTQDVIYVIGPYVTIRTLAMISLIPSVIFLILFGVCVPETPYYFVKNDNLKEAEIALIKTRQTKEVKEELQDILRAINESENQFSFKALIQSKAARKSFLLSFGLIFFQQFNGVSALSSYQQSIFDASKSSIPADKSVMVVGSVQLFAIFLVSKLVDKWGRKKLLITSYAGQLLALLGMGTYFHLQNKDIDVNCLFWLPIACVLVYSMSFKLGAGPVSWTITSEIFPPNFKFVLSPLIAFSMTCMSFLVTFVFPRFWAKFSLEMSFWIFSGVVACALPFVIFKIPETKGKTFLQIQSKLAGNS